MRSRKLIFAGLLTILVLGAAFLAVARGSTPSSGDSTATDIQFLTPSEFKVADYAGKPLVVNFFGSWCGPCNSEAPDLAAFAQANPDVQFVGIAVNDTESDVTAFMNKYGLSNPVVMDDDSLGAEYGVNGVPTTIFFDGAGQEVNRLVGASSLDQFDQSLAKAQ